VDPVFVVLLIVGIFHFVLAAVILPIVFRKDIREWRDGRRKGKQRISAPVCMYCGSRWTRARDEGRTRWDNHELVLVTAYECEHCRMPFWHVDRLATTATKH